MTRDYGSEVLVDETGLDLRVRHRPPAARPERRGRDPLRRRLRPVDRRARRAAERRAARSDWFFYVNGIESPIGAAEYELGDGDRVWWDYRDWTAAMRVPAVVGSWPEPFVHGFDGERWTAAVVCPAPSESASDGRAAASAERHRASPISRPKRERRRGRRTASPTSSSAPGTQVRTDPRRRRCSRGPPERERRLRDLHRRPARRAHAAQRARRAGGQPRARGRPGRGPAARRRPADLGGDRDRRRRSRRGRRAARASPSRIATRSRPSGHGEPIGVPVP